MRPRHVKQLQTGSPTASRDCGPASTVMALQGASSGQLVIPQPDQAEWIARLRREMTHPSFWPSTSLPVLVEAINTDFSEGAYFAGGRRGPRGTVQEISHTQAVEYLQQDAWLIVGIDYGRLNDLMPQLSGSPTFRGGHFIAMGPGDHGKAMLGDPLHDGRRAGIPKGWQTVRPMRYLRAAETFGTPRAGTNRAKVIVIRKPEGL